MGGYHGRATVDPDSPRAYGLCDRCGFLYNLADLDWQFDWAGTQLVNRRLRVCSSCMDEPSQQKRAFILPPDPVAVADPRPEDTDAANNNYITTQSGSRITTQDGNKLTTETSTGTALLRVD